MAETAIVILNWNTVKQLEKFLPSLVKNTPEQEAEIVVADNASTDGSADFVRKNYPSIRVIELDKNYGFTGGYNRALSMIDADFYVLLNSDIEVSPNWLSPLIKLLKSNPEIAVCQPKLRSYVQPEMFEYAGAAGGFIDHLGYPFCKGRIFTSIERDLNQYTGNYPVFWATGACMAVKADMFRKLNGLDNFFFAHMEEIDLCWRMQNNGFKVYCCAESTVYHIGGGTLPKTNPRKTFLNFRNNLILLYKNLPAGTRFRVLLIRHLLDFIALGKFATELKFAESLAVIKAYWAFYGYMFKFPQKPYATGLPEIIHKKSIVYQYYVAGKRTFNQL